MNADECGLSSSTKLRGMKTAKQGMKQGMKTEKMGMKTEKMGMAMGVRTEKMGAKAGVTEKSNSAGFIAKMKPETWSVNGFLLAISAPFAVSFELFSVLAFGKIDPAKAAFEWACRGRFAPKTMGMDGHGYGHELWAWLWAWVKTRKTGVWRGMD